MDTPQATLFEATPAAPGRFPVTRRGGIVAEGPGVASEARHGAPTGLLCRRCGSGPIAPGARCGWCGRRADRDGGLVRK